MLGRIKGERRTEALNMKVEAIGKQSSFVACFLLFW